ncbi:[protein-PII] uridylyltransferase [Gluconobacter morbifer]|uniref:Bifunctional uridylyltransferase/uridylyl-removing enzyme n=1 Tax=Gluconobacter morbifer G707 TaxID=1088869 RepID=G6XGG4_9PROT|nr:[protein-PII] uridylyltransferase [Gluconobacter morbifer]EHH69272.1 PII uridylyl-transferase [Gluconobacter morbifer G707]
MKDIGFWDEDHAFSFADNTDKPLPDRTSLAPSLQSALETASMQGLTSREDVLSILRRHLGAGHADIRRRFESRQLSGITAARALAAQADGMICALADLSARQEGISDEPLCLCATGGYGAGLLAPFSDIDILFLIPGDATPSLTTRIEFILYALWDLGLRVGHATRSIAACRKDAFTDLTIRTALLDLRFLHGERALARDLSSALGNDLQNDTLGDFVRGKIREREQRHRRYGDNPYMVEPNIKEGRGGLRDIQTLNWMGRAALGCAVSSPDHGSAPSAAPMTPSFSSFGMLTSREAHRARRAWDFLWTVRLHLHYITGRAEERLTFDVQPVIGGRMGYATHGRQRGVERFMRHYFLTARDVMRLTHVLQPVILMHLQDQSTQEPPQPVAGPEEFQRIAGRICPVEPVDFGKQPREMFRILDCARRMDLQLHPVAIQQIIRNERHAVALRHDPETARTFLDLLCAPSADETRAVPFWLPILNETGLLGRLLPDWSRVVGQMQFDSYHIYTVDEHIVEAVRMMGQIEAGHMADEIPLAYALASDLRSRRALYVAVLLHDIGKGRGGDHSEIGADLALSICPQLGLDSEETDTVSWLVLHHLLLSQTAFTRDIDDPRTILDLADTIQSPERLRLLLLLTIADMRAVSPKVWNAWKATLLRELFSRVAEVLEGGLAATERDSRVNHARELARDGLASLLPEKSIARFLDLGYPSYWLGFDTDTHMRHARMIHDSDRYRSPVTVEAYPIPDRGVTELTVLCADHPGLFSQIAGALAVAGASIVDARIHTLSDGMALDTFWVQDAEGCSFEEPHQLGRLNHLVEQALSGRLDIRQGIAEASHHGLSRRMRAIHVPPRVVIDNTASDRHTVIEVNGRDRPGLLHDVTSALSGQSLQISSAHITTYGMRAVDVFYVRDLLGMKIVDPVRLNRIREALLASLTPPQPATAPTA